MLKIILKMLILVPALFIITNIGSRANANDFHQESFLVQGYSLSHGYRSWQLNLNTGVKYSTHWPKRLNEVTFFAWAPMRLNYGNGTFRVPRFEIWVGYSTPETHTHTFTSASFSWYPIIGDPSWHVHQQNGYFNQIDKGFNAWLRVFYTFGHPDDYTLFWPGNWSNGRKTYILKD